MINHFSCLFVQDQDDKGTFMFHHWHLLVNSLLHPWEILFFKKRNESNQPEKRYLFWKRSQNHLEIKQLMSLCLLESTTSDYRSHTCEQKVLLPPSCMSEDLFILEKKECLFHSISNVRTFLWTKDGLVFQNGLWGLKFRDGIRIGFSFGSGGKLGWLWLG